MWDMEEKDKNKSSPIDICKESKYTFPNSTSLGNNINLQAFYQYTTANANQSPLSAKLDEILTDDEKDTLWKQMLIIAKINENKFIFNPRLRNKICDIRTLGLSDTTLVCDSVKGFIHQNDPSKNEKRSQHKLDALLKRMRDAFAHGRIAISGEYLILEDKKNELTARIIVTTDVLEQWMNIINKKIKEKQDEKE